MSRLDQPLAVVTTAAGEERAGCLIGFHAQCSIEPRRYTMWLSKADRTYRARCHCSASRYAIHFLDRSDHDLAELFGGNSGDDLDKFQHCDWSAGPSGVPLLVQVPNRLVLGRVALLDEGSDHVCLVTEPLEASSGPHFTPLRLSDAGDITTSHTRWRSARARSPSRCAERDDEAAPGPPPASRRRWASAASSGAKVRATRRVTAPPPPAAQARRACPVASGSRTTTPGRPVVPARTGPGKDRTRGRERRHPSRTAPMHRRLLDGAVGQRVDPVGHDLADAVGHVVAAGHHHVGAEGAHERLVGRRTRRR